MSDALALTGTRSTRYAFILKASGAITCSPSRNAQPAPAQNGGESASLLLNNGAKPILPRPYRLLAPTPNEPERVRAAHIQPPAGLTPAESQAADQPSVGPTNRPIAVTVISSQRRPCWLLSRVWNRIPNGGHNVRTAAHEAKSPHHSMTIVVGA